MYDDEKILDTNLPRILRISIINPKESKFDISKKILDKSDYQYKERLKFTLLTSIKNLYKPKKNLLEEEKNTKGLIDTRWFEDITNNKPCLIILYYHIEENNTNLELEQQKIYNLLEEIKKYDEYLSIFLFIIFKDNPENPYPFESEDKTKKYNLRNIIDKELIFVFPDEQIWKYIEFQSFCSNIVFYARKYYMKLKVEIKEKKNKSNRPEEKIEYEIMLGVLSTIKSKKIEPQISKHFEQAYNLLCDKNFDIKNYLYGNKSPSNYKLNFCEIRSAADWVFFKTLKLAKRNIKSNQKKIKGTSLMTKISGSESEHAIDRFMAHIKRFITDLSCDKTKEDCFAFVEYYWLFQRYDKLGKYIKENIKELSTNKDKVLFLGIVYLERIYSLIKMIKYYRKYLINKDMNTIKHKDKDININMVKNKKDHFYGKVPIFIIKDEHNPLFKEELPFDEEIFIKKFIHDKKLTLDNMVNDLNNKYIPETLDFYQKFNPKDLRNEKNEIINKVYGINLYLNILINLSCIDNTKNNNNIFDLPTFYKNNELINNIIHEFDYIKKFPQLYINFLNEFNKSLFYKMNKNTIDNFQKTQLFINLSILSYHRKLDQNEEDIFFNLLNDENFIPNNKNNDKNIFINLEYNTRNINIINNSNNSFIFDYSIIDHEKSQERKILDLIEYVFTFKTNLTKESIKFNSIKIIFRSINDYIMMKGNKNVISKKYEFIERIYNKDELDNYILDNNTPLNLHCKLFMKNKMNKIHVHKVIFNLCKKDNIFYQINIKNDLSKIIFLNKLNKNILNIKYPLKKYVAGVNQLFKFEFEVFKEILDDIKIADLKINFESLPSFYTVKDKDKNNNELNQNLINNNAVNLQNNLLNRNISNLPVIPNLTAFGQQLFNQQFTNNINNINNIANFNIQYLLQNNINNIAMTNNNQNIPNNPNMLNNINNYNALLYPNALGINQNLGLQKLPNPSMPNLTQNIALPTTTTTTTTKQVELPSPEFYIYNEEKKSIDKTEKSIEKSYNDFESLLENKKNKFAILIKFLQKGTYQIKFGVTFSLKRKDIDDFYELSQENMLTFQVVEPFICTHELDSSNFISVKQETSDKKNKKLITYLANKNININFILKNMLNENINIKNIEIEVDKDKLNDENKNIIINSNLLDVMNLQELDQEIKNDMLTILSTAEYCIPFETKFFKDFKGKIGKIRIRWTTPSLKDFEKNVENNDNKNINLINEDVFDFPYMIINKLELNYVYEIKMNNKKEVILNIKVENNTEKCKKIIFFIETGEEIHFMISGKIKQSKNIKARETITFLYKLIPLQTGELKLPSLKIWEINLNNLQEKLCSNYFCPQKITII